MSNIEEILGESANDLLSYQCQGVTRERLSLPGPHYVDDVVSKSDRSPVVMRNLQSLFNHGRLGGTGYLSILPVDQGIEHSAGASFAMNPDYFDPAKIVELALEGGCNAVASSRGVLGAVARRYAHKIPFIMKLNHNEHLSFPNTYDQRYFASVRQAYDMGAVAVGATIYFGSEDSRRQIEEVSRAFELAHELGLVTILWAYLRNSAFKTTEVDYHMAADLTGQANYLASSIGADLVKQKQPESNGGYTALCYGHSRPEMYGKLCLDHPIEWTRYQVANCFMGRAGLINSGGASGENDLQQAVKTAVINKRAGGMGLICGRKCFQRPVEEGIRLLHAIQDVYLDPKISVA